VTVPICFIDTETDGVHPGRKPWEVALIRHDENGERETSFFVEIDLSTADPFGLRVGRFYDRHPVGQWVAGQRAEPPVVRNDDDSFRSPLEAARTVAAWTHGAHLIGAVPNFDAEVFDRLLRDHGLCPSWHYHLVDVEALAVGYAAAKGITITPPWKSDDLMAVIGVEKPTEAERHTALGDARWAMRTYDAVMGGAR
jgi:hypothetical protein